jgi:hypothetical protein
MKKAMLVFLAIAAIPAVADPTPIKVRVHDWFRQGIEYRVNVQMPDAYGDNRGQWALTCNRGIDPGMFQGTYDASKNQLRLETTDLRGKAQITKCEVFSHSWRAPR